MLPSLRPFLRPSLRPSLPPLLLLALLGVRAQPACDYSLLLGAALPDRPGQPLALRTDVAADAQQCALACLADAGCEGFNFLAGGAAACSLLPRCPFPSGCCWLKANASSAASVLASGGGKSCLDACSFIVRAPAASLPPVPPPPPPPPAGAARNVLYVLVDDMRPDALPWGAGFMSTPSLARLAAGATVFSRAYCNIAVCSPSRMSFLSGRYPASTKQWNFLNHIRQASCDDLPGVSFGSPGGPGAAVTLFVTDGGAGQCCSFCSASPTCRAWTLAPRGFNDTATSQCTLFDAPPASPAPAGPGTISGWRGSTAPRDALVTLPQAFLQSGFLTLGTGKVFHTEEGGNGPAPWDGPGTGMPPLQDPVSWSRANASMANVNSVAPMRECTGGTCSVPADADGNVADPLHSFRFEDRIIGDDGLLRLREAAANRAATGQPFFLAVGFRKPHLPFRHPSAYDALYPAPADVPLARHKTLDASVPPIAFHQTSLAADPYEPMPDLRAGTLRRDYYAAISWTDSRIGALLDELDALGLANDTAVVFHADHGWSLGESGEWEKFTLWEAGTRVPLMVRAPWLSPGGVVSDEIVELIDVFPTLADLANVTAPADLDGESLVPALLRAAKAGAGAGALAGSGPPAEAVAPPPHAGSYALSVYPRCPASLSNASNLWQANDCLMVERSAFLVMGVSIRTLRWRYNEWLRWNGSELAPAWGLEPVGVELYDHEGDAGNSSTTYDLFEVVNVAGDPANAPVVAALSAQLRAAYDGAGGARASLE